MRNRKEIIEYIGLEMSESNIVENEKYIKASERIEREFEKELAEGIYGYGLHSDFVLDTSILDDGNLEEIANYDGVILYKRNDKVLTQGVHFDSYENTEKKNAYNRNIEILCNVTDETFNNVKVDEYVKVDFDGDGEVLWGVIITHKNKAKNQIYYYIV